MWWLIAGGFVAVLMIVEFVLICPDKLPWRRRK